MTVYGHYSDQEDNGDVAEVRLTRKGLNTIAAQVEAEARPLFAWLMVKIMRAELDGEGWGDAA
jgi:hypothetical protein